jgi:hypothetical protein
MERISDERLEEMIADVEDGKDCMYCLADEPRYLAAMAHELLAARNVVEWAAQQPCASIVYRGVRKEGCDCAPCIAHALMAGDKEER